MSDVSSTVLPALYRPTTPTRASIVLTRNKLIGMLAASRFQVPGFRFQTSGFQLGTWNLELGTPKREFSMSVIRFTAIDHCSVIITDVAKARTFYRDVLGLREIPKPKTFD